MDAFYQSFTASFWWGLSAFVVFVLILYRLGITAVLKAVDAREARIAHELAESEDAYKKAQSIKSELETRLRGCEARIGELMAEARRNADQLKAEAIEKGRVEVEAIRVRALRDIEAARHGAIVDLRHEVAELATMVAEKVLRERLDASKQEAYTAEAIAAFEARRSQAGRN